MKILKFIFYTFLLLTLLSVPIYSIGRILLPKWVTSQIASRLPEGSILTVGKMSSKSDLGILYENFNFESSNGFKIIISNFLVSPRLNIQKPLKFKAENAVFENNNVRINFSNVDSILSIDYDDIGNSTILGEMKDLQADEVVAISNIEFLIQGLSSNKSKIKLNADQFSAQILVPDGKIGAFGKKATFTTEIGNEISTYIKVDDVSLDLSMIKNFDQNSKIFGKNLTLDVSLLEKELWQMPISLELLNLRSEKGDISNKLNVKANGRWNSINKSCEWQDLFNSSVECGQLTDVLDVFFKLSQKNSMITLLGDGFCVTPGASCPQKITTKIRTKNTTEIFAKLMSSGIINPLFSGILLGSLLGSPNLENPEIDHEVQLKVDGSNIFVNGKPLI